MPVIHAVYENGVFKPKEPVALPESCEVEFEPRVVGATETTARPPLGGRPAHLPLKVPTLEASGTDTVPMFVSDPNPSPEEARRLLQEMAAMGSGQALPADWSRADLYDDHD